MSPFVHEPRKRLTAQERAQIFANGNGHCADCTRPLTSKDCWDADHITPLELGGTNDLSNFQCLCEHCHAKKTASDHGEAGHMRRAYTKHVVPKRFQKSRSWR